MNSIVNFFLILFPLHLLAQPWSTVYQQTYRSLPVIISSGATCTGALVEKNWVLTSAHCVDQYRSIRVYFKINDWVPFKARRIQILEASDLALLELDQEIPLPILKVFPKSEMIYEGQNIATIGHPLGSTHFKVSSLFKSEYLHVISSGLVSKVGPHGFVSDMSVSPGNSGGPVFDQKGQIMGVVSKKRIDRYSGDLGYFSNHQQIHRLIENKKNQIPHRDTLLNARTTADLYLIYSQPNFRKNREGDAKTYWNVGVGIQVWDRLRLAMDTNLDTKEAFTQYGLGWSYHIQAEDPLQYYRIIPAVEIIKFRFRDELQNDKTVEKFTSAISLSFKPSWFPLFVKVSGFQIEKESYSMVGLGILF